MSATFIEMNRFSMGYDSYFTQTANFYLDTSRVICITYILLDRFLACMKPASILDALLVRAFFFDSKYWYFFK